MSNSTMLIISQDPTLMETARGILRTIDQIEPSILQSIDEAYDYPNWEDVSLVLLHLDRPSLSGEATRLLRMIQATNRPIATLVVSDYDEPSQSVTLLQLGVADYLTRPLDVRRLTYLIESLTARSRYLQSPSPEPALQRPVSRVIAGTPEDADLSGDAITLGYDRLSAQIRRVAPQVATILLGGETGTGKTRLARVIHDLSKRRDEPFLVVNCGALSTSLIESEMFGHVRGSFTGADRDRVGKFAEVGRGTLFLDEIDTLPPAMQAKLLRVVEDREFEPVGSNRTQPVLARLIAASNQGLEEEVAAGRFRSDLFYRLNVVNFYLPPLREHRGSVSGLVSRFIKEFAVRSGQPPLSISSAAVRSLETYQWPGNIRELRNVIERAVALCPGPEIHVDDLPEAVRRQPIWTTSDGFETERCLSILADGTPDPENFSRSTLAQIKHDAELARISEALRKHSNNRLRAASELGISRMTLYKKLYKYGLMTAGGRHDSTEARNHVS